MNDPALTKIGYGSSMPGPFYYARQRGGRRTPFGDYLWKPVNGLAGYDAYG
jgi:hypothetical protein